VKQRHFKMPNPVSVATSVTSNRRSGCITASFALGKAHGRGTASAEHRIISHQGSLMRRVLSVPDSEGQGSVSSTGRGSVACEEMLSNNALERAVKHLATCRRSCGWLALEAPGAAAQLGR